MYEIIKTSYFVINFKKDIKINMFFKLLNFQCKKISLKERVIFIPN